MPIAHFVFYTIVNVPVNVYWQNWLEATFPGNTPVPASEIKEKKGEKPKEQKTKLNVTNTFIKFVMDQTVGALINIPMFLAAIGFAKGQSTEHIVNTIKAVSLVNLYFDYICRD